MSTLPYLTYFFGQFLYLAKNIDLGVFGLVEQVTDLHHTKSTY